MSYFLFQYTRSGRPKACNTIFKGKLFRLKTEKINIKTLKDGEVVSIDKTLSLGKFEIDVIYARRDGDEMIDDLRIRGISGYGIWFSEFSYFLNLFTILKEK
ncbi:MAG: hypothetical protein GXZ06_11680 [Tissierellia bacterium]|nr:hypothetical protein [Tissierellia bacterium]